MAQKVIRIGKSAGITISRETLQELGLGIGDPVRVEVDRRRNVFTVAPREELSGEDKKIARLTSQFIERYREDLEELAKE